ncbi:MAG: response regulator [Clostridia bacterium]|nr:response regulator [Clostridia bacterium]
MKRALEIFKKYQMYVFTAVAVVICVTASLLGYYYLSRMKNALWNQLIVDLTEITYQGGHAFETYASQEYSSIERIALDLSKPGMKPDDETLHSILDKYSLTGDMYSLIVSGDNGSTVYLAGQSPEHLSKAETADILSGCQGDSGITKPYLNYYNGKLTLGAYKKFSFEDGTTAVIRKGQTIDTLRQEFSLSFYNETGFSYIIDSDGSFLVRPTHKNSNRTAENLSDLLLQSGSTEQETENIKKLMDEGKRGALRLTSNDEGRVVAFVPLKSTDNYLVSIVPNSSIVNHIDDVLQTSQTLTVIVLLVFIIFIVFILVTYFYRRKIMAGETEVKYREQLFGLLANTTDDVYMLMSLKDFSLEYVSPNALRVLGIAPKDIQKAIHAIATQEYDDDLSISLKSLVNLKDGESETNKRNRMHKTTGEIKHFVETVYRTTIDNVDKFIILLSDRTAEIQSETALKDAMESAQAANKAKSVFLSNMSHDIRTPMNAILGFTELIKRDSQNHEKVIEYTNKIYSSGQHLLGLINDVLDMSKIENGNNVLNIQKFNLAEFVDELGNMMRPQAVSKNQIFEICVHDLKEENLLGDKLRINQILINILSNAIKYTPENGTVKMEISELPRINENFARLRFTITDNGIGISDDYLEHIFKPFTRELSSTVNSIQGTGLGMAITKNLVDLMSGTISVKSKQGFGSTFTVELELRIDDDDVNNGFWEDAGISRTLVVDDDEDICKNVTAALADAGMDASYVLSGSEAIALVKEKHAKNEDFDLILIDMKMPDMDGIETAERIRKIISKDISIVMLTAYDWNEIEDSAREAGIDAFLPKPFFVSNLKLNIRSMNKNKEEESTPKKALEGKRFLAAEDNELNSEILVELLDMYSSSCEVAENGKIALEMFEKSPQGYYDGVLMDIQMPVMNGYEAARAIRNSSHPDAKTIPIIAMTANAFSEDINNSLNAGMDAHIAKPMDMEKLESVYRDIISKNN